MKWFHFPVIRITEVPFCHIPLPGLQSRKPAPSGWDRQNRLHRPQLLKIPLLTDFTEEELRNCINKAYDSKFDAPEIAPLVKKGNSYYLELFHGSTIAFKDMALSILPHLLTTAAKKKWCYQ